MNFNNQLKEELGEENYKLFDEMRKIREISGKMQARLPFSFSVN
jgi:hypothetical protein